MRNIAKRLTCVLAGLAVVLLGVSSAQADIVWHAPDVSYETPASSSIVDYTLQMGSTGSDQITGFNFKVLLVQTSGTGSVSFGTVAEPTSNYVFTQSHAGLSPFGTNNASTVQADDGLLVTGQFATLSSSLRNLATIPLTIAAGTAGTWEVRFQAYPASTAASPDFEDLVNAPFDPGTITIEAAAVPLPLAAWGGLALFGLVGARKWRKNRTPKVS